ncbi:MAG: signal peptidase I, partial [Defluviitaleaceae bacterium]|nr:signal peptidase I [Defluviitaleaceae bacterium]
GAAFLLGHYVIVNATVPSGSMLNTIQEESRIVAFRLSYLFSEPERLDVIVFKYPDNEEKLYVKRIIGLPGDYVEIKSGKVFINGTELEDETYISSVKVENMGPFIVPEDSYFMLGDNRRNSEDSRSWRNTFVEKDKILGKVIFSYFPSIRSIK